MLQVFLPLLICVGSAISRETAKTYRSVPTISNSLVNLGKMDISFYFNGKPDTGRSDHSLHTSSFALPKQEVVDEPCACSNVRNMKESFFTNPSDIISKILRSNDLFTNKEPVTSTLCCDSTHEHEETVYFEITPNQKKQNNPKANIFPPYIFDSLMPNRHTPSPLKPKAVEIFLFPKRKDLATFELPQFMPKKNTLIKDRIQIVGDKLTPEGKLVTSSSVKKDLVEKEKKEVEKQEPLTEKDEVITKPNAL